MRSPFRSKPTLIKFVGTVEKNRREVFDCAIRQYGERVAVDLRVHALRNGDHIPTERGLAVGLADLRAVRRMFDKADREAVALGLLPEERTRS